MFVSTFLFGYSALSRWGDDIYSLYFHTIWLHVSAQFAQTSLIELSTEKGERSFATDKLIFKYYTNRIFEDGTYLKCLLIHLADVTWILRVLEEEKLNDKLYDQNTSYERKNRIQKDSEQIRYSNEFIPSVVVKKYKNQVDLLLNEIKKYNLEHFIIHNVDGSISFKTGDKDAPERSSFQRDHFFYEKNEQLEKEIKRASRTKCFKCCTRFSHQMCIHKMCKACCLDTVDHTKVCKVHKISVAPSDPSIKKRKKRKAESSPSSVSVKKQKVIIEPRPKPSTSQSSSNVEKETTSIPNSFCKASFEEFYIYIENTD